MRSRNVRALAVDYDRTLTAPEFLRRVPRALGALARARAAGGKVVVVSGRDLPFLEREVGHVCDAIVAENGCFLKLDGEPRQLGPALDLRAAFADLAVPIDHAQGHASALLEHEALLRATIERSGVAAHLVRNRDRVMVLPRGVDKALGVLAALEALRIAPSQAAAIGDGENDVALVEAVGLRLAVANAVEELKAVAHHVTRASGGDGVAEWVEGESIPALEVAA